MLKTVYSMYSLSRLGRPYYVLPVMTTAIAGYWTGSDSASLWPIPSVLCVVFLVLGMCCWAVNEITDRHADSYGNTRKKWGIYVSGGTAILSSGQVSFRSALICVVILGTTGLAIATLLGITFWCLSALFVFIGLAYSVKPVRLKERGILGLAMVAVAYGAVAYTAGWVASGQRLTSECLLFSCVLSIAFFGFEGIAHLLDHEQDRRNEEATIAVSLGREMARRVLAICQSLPVLVLILVSLLAPSVISHSSLALLIPFLFISILISILTASCRKDSLMSSLRVLSVPFMSAFAFLIA